MIPNEVYSIASGIIKTKLYIPRLPGDFVQRPRLIEKINHGVQHKLVLIVAPAGFGKSTLLSEWVTQADMPVCWLSLDKSGNNPQVLLSYLIASTQTLFPAIGVSIQATLNSPSSPFLYTLINAFINEIYELDQDFVIIVDDFHHIDAKPTIDALCYLIENQPSKLHLIIAGRSELPISCPRLRIRGEMIQLGIDDLRFNYTETLKFLRARLGMRISSKEIAILENRTEGWIAGLQMAAISLQSEEDVETYVAGFSGANRLVTDYLIDEVLSHQEPDLQDFLLKTSILNELSASLCNYVVNSLDSQLFLETLEQKGLFVIPLDNSRTWYRYHHLFADLLHNRLRMIYPDEETGLHIKASEWHLSHDMPEDAVEQIFATQDSYLTVHRIEQVSSNMLANGKFERFIEWLDRVPQPYVESKPYLVLVKAFMLFELSDLQGCLRSLEIAEDLIGPAPVGETQSLKLLTQLYGVLTVIKSAYFYGGEGDVEKAYLSAELALKYMPDELPFWRTLALMLVGAYFQWQGNYDIAIEYFREATEVNLKEENLFLGIISLSILAKLYLKTGRITQAIEICQKAVDREQSKDFKITYTGLIYLTLAELCYLKADFDDAERYALHGIDLVEKHKDLNSMINGYFTLSRIHLSRRKREKAQEVMKNLIALIRDYSPSENALKKAFACQAYISRYAGNLKHAKRWMESPGYDVLDAEHPFDVSSNYAYRGVYLAPQELVSEVMSFIDLTKACLYYSEYELATALKIIDSALVDVKNQKRIYMRIQFLIVKALVLYESNRQDDAAYALLEAICYSGPEKIIQPFMLEGESLHPILNQTVKSLLVKEILNAEDLFNLQFIDHLLSHITRAVGRKKKHFQYGLTPREVQVIRWLSKGLSYAETSEQLSISENTFRTYIKKVYSKLGVNNRLQAANKAEKLGLLSENQRQ
jgi:LuxR family transcriptional regulator, maltose regulon positive regulatory protein